MAKTKKEAKLKEKIAEKATENKAGICEDKKCPFHGSLSLRGRIFRGVVVKKFLKRVVIVLERTIYMKKVERFAKIMTKIHARLPDCLNDVINIGDYVEISECRKLSKLISFVVVKRLKTKAEMENLKEREKSWENKPKLGEEK
jgi:small subunit ribosomal protein S17